MWMCAASEVRIGVKNMKINDKDLVKINTYFVCESSFGCS